jgi:hypothetical protein
MAWAKFDDRFLINPKIMQAGLEARALYIAGVLYCAGELTDGFIAEGVLCKLAALADVPRAIDAADRLIDLALWEQAEGGYIVHDYLEYNPTAEEVKARRDEVTKARSEAGKKGMAARWGDKDNKITNDITKPKQSGLLPVDNKPITPYPSRTPSPLTSSTAVEEESTRAPIAKKTALPRTFAVTEEMDEWARANCQGVDIEWATEEWLDYIRSQNIKSADWDAEWRKGMRNAKRFAAKNGSKPNGTRPTEGHKGAQAALRNFEAIRNRLSSSSSGTSDNHYQLGPGEDTA